MNEENFKEKLKELMDEKKNSFQFRWGGTSTDVKIYFEDAQDLQDQISELEGSMRSIKEDVSKIRETMSE